MKSNILIFCSVFLFGCSKDDTTYPKSYTYSSLDQTDEGLFVLSSVSGAIQIDINTGLYGVNRDAIKQESREFITTILDIKEIKLLSEDSVRIHFISNEEDIDTIVTYSLEDETIIIDYLNATDFIYYDTENDHFILCGLSLVALPGPNVTNPGLEYNTLIIKGCPEDSSVESSLQDILDEYSFLEMDTIGILISKFIYR